METVHPIKNADVPLYKQLLVLIPLLRIIEKNQGLREKPLQGLRLEVTHRQSGKLSVAFRETRPSPDDDDRPEFSLTLNSTTRNNGDLTYQHTFLMAWEYLFGRKKMNQDEYEKLNEAFYVYWHSYLIGHEKRIKEMGWE